MSEPVLHCFHGVPPYMVCLKCEELRRQERREYALAEALERSLVVCERLEALLAEREA